MRTDKLTLGFAYLRLSNEEAQSGESSSITNQRMIVENYCKQNGIISKDYNYTKNVTRADYMSIFAKALPDVPLIDGNNGTARRLEYLLAERDLLRREGEGSVIFRTSGDENVYIPLMKRLFDTPI